MHEHAHTVHEVAGRRVVVTNSVTSLTAAETGTVSVHGSHCGSNVPQYALDVGAVGMIGNDAGIGLDDAGIAGLAILEAAGVPGAAVEAMSARIGDGMSTWETGVISRVNDRARACGVTPGMSVRQAARAMAKAAGAVSS